MEAVKGSGVEVLDPKYGDTGKEVQAKLVEDVLQVEPRHVVYRGHGGRPPRPPKASLRARGLDKKVKLLAFYLHARRYEGIADGRILAAPADSMVIQGRIAIDQAVRMLEGKDVIKHVGPKIYVSTRKTSRLLRS